MKLVITGSLPSLNEYIQAERSNRYAAAQLKRTATDLVAFSCRQQKMSCVTAPVVVSVHWVMANKRKDIDNVAFAVKFILDGLVAAGILYDDSQEWVKGLRHRFSIEPSSPRVEVVLTQVPS